MDAHAHLVEDILHRPTVQFLIHGLLCGGLVGLGYFGGAVGIGHGDPLRHVISDIIGRIVLQDLDRLDRHRGDLAVMGCGDQPVLDRDADGFRARHLDLFAVGIDVEIAFKTRWPFDQIEPEKRVQLGFGQSAVAIGIKTVILEDQQREEIVIGPGDRHAGDFAGLVDLEPQGGVDKDVRMRAKRRGNQTKNEGAEGMFHRLPR